MLKVYEVSAKRVMTKTHIPGADWSINHYSGCQHSCIYCYARFICRWRKTKEAWGQFVDVKVNAPDLVSKESKDKQGSVILCTVSDAYQPIERKYKLTREVLSKLNPELTPIILTKSDLITRDVDVFSRFKHIELGMTITTLDDHVRALFEPNTSPVKARLRALKKLKQNGFHTYAFIGPILPYITDLPALIDTLSPFVDTLMFEDLNMMPARKSILAVIENNFPDLLDKYYSLSKSFWLDREREILSLTKQYGVPAKIYFKSTGSLYFK